MIPWVIDINSTESEIIFVEDQQRKTHFPGSCSVICVHDNIHVLISGCAHEHVAGALNSLKNGSIIDGNNGLSKKSVKLT